MNVRVTFFIFIITKYLYKNPDVRKDLREIFLWILIFVRKYFLKGNYPMNELVTRSQRVKRFSRNVGVLTKEERGNAQ